MRPPSLAIAVTVQERPEMDLLCDRESVASLPWALPGRRGWSETWASRLGGPHLAP